MTLDELKTGMHVITREGDEFIVLKNSCVTDSNVWCYDCDKELYRDVIITVNGCYASLSHYNNNLENNISRDLDIIAVYRPNYPHLIFTSIYDCNSYNNNDEFTCIYKEC